MFESFIQSAYWFMLVQVIVTLLVFPKINTQRSMDAIKSYLLVYYPEAEKEVKQYLAKRLPMVWLAVALCFTLAMIIVLSAFVYETELFNWDNQAGLIVLFFIGFAPVLALTIVQRGIFQIFKQYTGGVRTASLQPRSYLHYFPKPMLVFLVFTQFLFVATVAYFIAHPFDGFAGAGNLLGLLFLNLIFVLVSYVILTTNKLVTVKDATQREIIKSKGIKINLAIWIIAVLQLSVSMWLTGLDMKEYSLFAQSIYFQIILFLSAYSLTPVKLNYA